MGAPACIDPPAPRRVRELIRGWAHLYRLPIDCLAGDRPTSTTTELPSDAIVEPDPAPEESPERELGDFTTSPAVLGTGAGGDRARVVVTFLALGLLDLIGLITHLAYTGTIGTSLSPPDTRCSDR